MYVALLYMCLGMCSISACWLLIGKPCNIMPVIYFSSGVIVMHVYCSIADGELYDLGMVMIWNMYVALLYMCLGMCSISVCWLLIGKPCNIMMIVYFSSYVIVMCIVELQMAHCMILVW